MLLQPRSPTVVWDERCRRERLLQVSSMGSLPCSPCRRDGDGHIFVLNALHCTTSLLLTSFAAISRLQNGSEYVGLLANRIQCIWISLRANLCGLDVLADAYGASVPWCAPEQLLGDPCTPATDMFALAVILWELCTGDQPSQRRNFRQIKSPKEAPEAIVRLIWSCLNFEPELRPTASGAHKIIAACSPK